MGSLNRDALLLSPQEAPWPAEKKHFKRSSIENDHLLFPLTSLTKSRASMVDRLTPLTKSRASMVDRLTPLTKSRASMVDRLTPLTKSRASMVDKLTQLRVCWYWIKSLGSILFSRKDNISCNTEWKIDLPLQWKQSSTASCYRKLYSSDQSAGHCVVGQDSGLFFSASRTSFACLRGLWSKGTYIYVLKPWHELIIALHSPMLEVHVRMQTALSLRRTQVGLEQFGMQTGVGQMCTQTVIVSVHMQSEACRWFTCNCTNETCKHYTDNFLYIATLCRKKNCISFPHALPRTTPKRKSFVVTGTEHFQH